MSVLLQDADVSAVENAFTELERQGAEELLSEGVSGDTIRCERSADLRYRGQSAALNVDWKHTEHIQQAFHDEHLRHFGHRLELPVELVNLRVRIVGPTPSLPPFAGGSDGEDRPRLTRIYGIAAAVPSWRRGQLRPGEDYAGPAVITDAVSTTYLAPGWRCRRDLFGNLLLERD